MIKLYRWHVSKFYRPTEIDSFDQLKEISPPMGIANKLSVALDSSQFETVGEFKIKKTVEFYISYHTLQSNVYLVINNTRYKDTAVFAEIKGSCDIEMDITINPSITRTLIDFGQAIALKMTEASYLRIELKGETLELNLEVEDWSAPPITIPMEDLQDFFDENDPLEVPDMEPDEVDEIDEDFEKDAEPEDE